ncbi:hypothetical protein LWI29_036496 [Acer saccharum]|uniref:Uncharacterized protein n=1 Tax=Acer saccharum TaxID=4024 RepID=A0AA39VCS4_ACESA|nr:hypothetical protein LWI29_036496 [Acer saccharum]
MCVDGSSSGPGWVIGEEAQGRGLVSGGISISPVSKANGPQTIMTKDRVESPRKQIGNLAPVQESESDVQTGLKVKGKKWKRVAREVQRKQKSGLLASPLKRKLLANLPSLKSPTKTSPFKISNSPNRTNSPIRTNYSPKTSSEKRKAGFLNSQPSPQSQCNQTKQNPDRRLGNVRTTVEKEAGDDVSVLLMETMASNLADEEVVDHQSTIVASWRSQRRAAGGIGNSMAKLGWPMRWQLVRIGRYRAR